MSGSPRPAEYHLLDVAGKRTYSRVCTLAETRCPSCHTGLFARELEAHGERCPGSRERRDTEIWRRRIALDLRRQRLARAPWLARGRR
ncbi:MAG: hypothetical protein ABI467_11325 [Kofleriaceae bacterium]